MVQSVLLVMPYWIRTPIGTLFQKAVKMTFTIESVFV